MTIEQAGWHMDPGPPSWDPKLPTMVNPLGVKGAGQAGCIAAPQTIINAILDAVAPLGIDHIDMPATPERVWRAIRRVRG